MACMIRRFSCGFVTQPGGKRSTGIIGSWMRAGPCSLDQTREVVEPGQFEGLHLVDKAAGGE